MITKRDMILLAGILVLAVCLGPVLKLINWARSNIAFSENAAQITMVEMDTAAPAHLATAATSNATLLAAYDLAEAAAYLVIWTDKNSFRAVPLLAEYADRLMSIQLHDGTDENVVRLGANGFAMASANCPDQICVSEGEVTLDNRKTRALGANLICLPHQLTLELVDAPEMVALLKQADSGPEPLL